MKKYILILLSIVLYYINCSAQNILRTNETDWPLVEETQESTLASKEMQIMSCAANTIFTTGYPAWTNYYAGYMFKVNNTSTCSIVVNCFEARFQGTSGYRIYTKTGTFIGFETLSGSWTLVGTANNVTGISTVTCSPIPIVVNVTIPAGQSQSFYLTRTDNLVANRHLYITGTGTAGTTIYASDANVQITEAEYLDVYFLLQVGVRRPSFNMYYDKICGVLPIELAHFNVQTINNINSLAWITATESNNDYFQIERSLDGTNWIEVSKVNGSGNSTTQKKYIYNDEKFEHTLNYYRIKQVDFDGRYKYSHIVVVNNTNESKDNLIKRFNLLGQEVDNNYNGVYFELYTSGKCIKVLH